MFIIVDGATTFVTAFAPRTKGSHDSVKFLMEWMDTLFTPLPFLFVQIWPSKMSSVVSTLNLCFPTGPYTPWPNIAEAAVRVFKETLHDLCSQIGSAPELKQVTVRELIRKSAAVRNSMVTYGGKPLVELVFWKKTA